MDGAALEVHVSSVLIVDDESRIREILSRWLTPAGYETREAADADLALEALAISPADVVLCDVHMPGRDGLWLMGKIRERFPEIAVVLATSDDAVPPTTSLQPGVVEYLVKPFTRESVLAAVARSVEWHRSALLRGPQRASGSVEDWLKSGDK